MDWIFDHFNIVVILAIVVASLAKRILDAKAAGRESQEQTGELFNPADDWNPPVSPRAPSVPPPLIRTVPPPIQAQNTPPPLYQESSEIEASFRRQQEMQDRLKQFKEAKSAPAPKSMTTSSKRTAKQSSPPVGLRGTLRQRKELRRAIILREILGPPVGLR